MKVERRERKGVSIHFKNRENSTKTKARKWEN
jgi:hypothetical protein